MMTYQQVLKQAETRARAVSKEVQAIKILLLHYSHLEPNQLYLQFKEEMDEESLNQFEEALNKYLIDNIPVQYIIGQVYFYGYSFFVNEGVLIPRFETEELVANVLIQYDELFNTQDVKMVDIGTGSGCLAIALQKEEPHLSVTATDISSEALAVAKRNAQSLEADVTFLQGDMLEPLKGMKFDIIVSNPPYIPLSENVDSIIKDNEPNVALFGGSDGLKFYEIILQNARSILNEKFFIAFEHAFDKKDELQALSKKYFPDARVYTLKDMQGKDRMTFIVQDETKE